MQCEQATTGIPPRALNMFKLVHLDLIIQPPPDLVGKIAVDLRLKGLLVYDYTYWLLTDFKGDMPLKDTVK